MPIKQIMGINQIKTLTKKTNYDYTYPSCPVFILEFRQS